MRKMNFICVFLILAPALTLAEPGDISDLTHYKEASFTFKEIDTNHDGILELEELTASFDVFKEKPSDSGITREWFVDLLVTDGTSEDAAGKLFDAYDLDGDGVLNDSDYAALKQSFDSDGDGRVSAEEFIGSFNDILTNAGADVREIERR
ncbi:unnamed protein product [Lymnaea stagnalis]|uniref:EF-hand domain-containing protein n=1 Tax=Lymnaea stagnalis TaxID=6523 RepID=A0AAV2IBI3_LYMST